MFASRTLSCLFCPAVIKPVELVRVGNQNEVACGFTGCHLSEQIQQKGIVGLLVCLLQGMRPAGSEEADDFMKSMAAKTSSAREMEPAWTF